jgi:hypothetical protein
LITVIGSIRRAGGIVRSLRNTVGQAGGIFIFIWGFVNVVRGTYRWIGKKFRLVRGVVRVKRGKSRIVRGKSGNIRGLIGTGVFKKLCKQQLIIYTVS